MPRYYKRFYRSKSLKYSNENACIASVLGADPTDEAGTHKQGNFQLIPATTAQGTRKVKNLTLRILLGPSFDIDKTDPTNRSEHPGSLSFVVVFVPEGTLPSAINVGDQSISMYEPNQNVILTGIINNDQAYTFRTRLARNLNSGDSIYIVLRDNNAVTETTYTQTAAQFMLNYAIAY